MSWQQQRDRIDGRLAAVVGADSGRRRALRLLTTGVALLFVLAAIVSLSTQEWGFAAAWIAVTAALLLGNHRYLSAPPTPYPPARARSTQQHTRVR